VPSLEELGVDGLSPGELAVMIEFEEQQRDLEERVADIADLVRALKARDQPDQKNDRKGAEGKES
jgi:hypothetical protein